MSSPPLFSIVIVNYNGLKYLEKCLNSIFRTEYPNYEVILVDNNSTDGSLERSKKYEKLVLIENSENKGFAEGCNLGISAARGDLITLLNNDTVVDKDWLSEILKVMHADPSIGVSQSKLILMNTDNVLDDTGAFLDRNGFFVHLGLLQKDTGEFDKIYTIFSAKGAAMTIRRSVLDCTGLLDNDFFAYMEESDLCWRIWLNGYKVVFAPKSIVYHAWGASSTPRKARQFTLYFGTRNRLMMLIKNLETKNIPSFLIRNITINFAIALFLLTKGQIGESMMVFKGILWNLVHIKKILKKRSHIQKHVRTVSDSYLFKYIIRKQSLLDLYKYHNNYVKPRLTLRP